MLSLSFDNRCPFCRVNLLKPDRLVRNRRTYISRTNQKILDFGACAMFQNGEVEATIREAMFQKVWGVEFDEHVSLAIGQNCERPMIRLEEHLVLCRMEEEAEANPGPQAGEPLDLRALLINQRADQD